MWSKSDRAKYDRGHLDASKNRLRRGRGGLGEVHPGVLDRRPVQWRAVLHRLGGM